ncbi:esterase/lipase family protein [Rhizobium sp. 1399]|uniref:esterase/lipase family protein n=1 Tax=Rhizobium sp. 1399 TaxID=2817758 RepID=UPI003865EB2C
MASGGPALPCASLKSPADPRLITRNVDYPSTRYPIERLAQIVAEEVGDAAESNREGRLHLIGHSMGGLVIRAMLKDYRPSNLGRVVMIGTPNNGSQVADFLKKCRCIKQLSAQPASSLSPIRARSPIFSVRWISNWASSPEPEPSIPSRH